MFGDVYHRWLCRNRFPAKFVIFLAHEATRYNFQFTSYRFFAGFYYLYSVEEHSLIETEKALLNVPFKHFYVLQYNTVKFRSRDRNKRASPNALTTYHLYST